MGTFILVFLIASFIVFPLWVAISWNRKVSRKLKDMPTVKCTVCGHDVKLLFGTRKCRKCKTRFVETVDGEIKSV